MAKVEIINGISLPDDFIQEKEEESLGFPFWYGKAGSGLTQVALKAQPYTIVVKNGNSEAYVPCFKRKILPGLTFMCGYPYVRIFGNQQLFFDNIDLVIRTCAKEQIARIELIVSGSDLGLIDLLTKLNHKAITVLEKTKYTRQIVNIASLAQANDLALAFSGKLRWSINKAIKENVTCTKLTGESAQPAQKLYTQVMRQKGAPVYYGLDRFQYIVDTLTPADRGYIYLASIGSEIAGMAAVLYSDQSAHLLQVAVPRRFSPSRIGDYLIALAQFEAAKSGKHYFDFLATPEFEPGVMEYKAKWGGRSENVETIVINVQKCRSQAIDCLRSLSRGLSSLTSSKSRE